MSHHNSGSCNRHVRVAMLSLFMSISALSTGCATMLNGPTQLIRVSSTPDGAQVLINEKIVGTTPCVVDLQRSHDYALVLKKDGYKPLTCPLRRVSSGATLGNILFGGLFGLAVDAMSGANYKFATESVQTVLEEVPTYASSDLRERPGPLSRDEMPAIAVPDAIASSQLPPAEAAVGFEP